MTQTAGALGLERSHLYRKMKSLESPLRSNIHGLNADAPCHSLFPRAINSCRIRETWVNHFAALTGTAVLARTLSVPPPLHSQDFWLNDIGLPGSSTTYD